MHSLFRPGLFSLLSERVICLSFYVVDEIITHEPKNQHKENMERQVQNLTIDSGHYPQKKLNLSFSAAFYGL